MGKKKKLLHFAENDTFLNMFQPDYPQLQKGFPLLNRWNSEFFKNTNPITLEVGCGKGEYTVGLAQKYPHRNFIGIDLKGARMWRGCKTSNDLGLYNVAFIRQYVQQLPLLFGPAEVDEIWITFPDPQPKNVKRNKRLTSMPLLKRYAKILNPNGIIHLKTDSEFLFDFTMEVIQEEGHELLVSHKDIYAEQGFEEVKSIKTVYEKIFTEKGFAINYLQFKLNPNYFQSDDGSKK